MKTLKKMLSKSQPLKSSTTPNRQFINPMLKPLKKIPNKPLKNMVPMQKKKITPSPKKYYA